MQMKNVRYILIFCLSLLLFNWPVLSIAGNGEPVVFFLYLFSAWLFIIALVFLNGLSLPDVRDDLAGGKGISEPGAEGAVPENESASPRKGENIANPDGADHV